MTIYVASGNAGKLAEFAASARGGEVEVLALPGLAAMPEPAEDAGTFMGNAELKAVAYSRRAAEDGGRGLLVMADDSGLEVDALGGRPGVRSARFAEDLGFGGEAGAGGGSGLGRNERNLAALLELMREVPEGERTARFRCALALAREGAVVLRAEGVVEGVILREGRGVGGFGYDPAFLVPGVGGGAGQTLAEMPREAKWAVSHRGEAFRRLLERLRAGV